MDEVILSRIREEAYEQGYQDGKVEGYNLVGKALLPQRKKGKWIWLSSTYDRTPCEMRYMCSECHHETIVHSNEMASPWENYCPVCGAENQSTMGQLNDDAQSTKGGDEE